MKSYICDNCKEKKKRDQFYPKDMHDHPSTSKCIDCRKKERAEQNDQKDDSEKDDSE